MDLRFLLNPMPEDEVPRITSSPAQNNATASVPGTPPEQQPQSTASYLHSRLLLSPRRLDAETASVSSTSSTKRRRTNRGGRVDVRQGNAPAMGRSFSEIEVPSEDSSNEEQDAVKRGVAQLSLSGSGPRVVWWLTRV
jgi:hypothetical protein